MIYRYALAPALTANNPPNPPSHIIYS